MKKFTKILTIILALAVITTAFMLVTLAEDDQESQPYTFTQNQAKKDLDFDDTWELDEKLNTKTTTDGTVSFIKIQETYPGGNKYMYIDGMGTSSGAAAWFSEITYSRDKYHVGKMPIVAIDFDVMSTNGRFGSTHNSTNIVLRPYYYTGSKYLQFGSSTTGAASAVSLGQIKLNNEAYLWQHVTIIYEWVEGGTINTYVHINGSEEPTYTTTKNVSSSYSSYAEYIDYTFFGVPYITAASWGEKAQVALDNYKQTYFPVGYELSDVPTYIYNSSYVMPEDYKYTVATVTDNDGNVTYHDDINEATASLEDGYTLTLTESPAEAILINKAITLNSNGYDFNYTSTDGYGPTSELDGVYVFEKLPSAIVKWDVCPNPDDCECLGAHALSAESSVIIGAVPEYTFDIPEFETNGLVLTLIGWSYENDGTVDDLLAITAEDIENGEITLYPVFSQAQYDFRLESNGTVTYYTADQYAQIFTDAEKADNVQRTITLLRDAEVYDMIQFTAGWSSGYVQLVLDLRGNTLTRVDLVGNKYKYNTESGAYEPDGTLASTGSYTFAFNKANTTFTVTSSASKKGSIITYKVNGDIYYDENGALERYDATTISASPFLNMYNAANRHAILNNINIYSKQIINASGGSNTNCSFTINNCNYYATFGSDKAMDRTIYLESSEKFSATLTNTLFYYPSNGTGTKQVFRLADNNKKSEYTVTVDGCDIVGMTNMDLFTFYSTAPKIKTPNVTVTNTRLYNAGGNSFYTTYLGEGTVYNSRATSNTTILAGNVSVPVTESIAYALPTTSIIAIDTETKQPVFSSETTETSLNFTYHVKNCSDVPESITDARIAMLYYTSFDMMLYIPVTDGMSVNSVTGFTGGTDIVRIDGNPYYVYRRACATADASDSVHTVIKYTINGGVYTQEFDVSALVYANIILSDPLMEEETKAVANMVRFIKEARSAKGLAIPAEMTELEELYELDAYKAKEDYDTVAVDYSGLSGVSVSFAIDGTNAGFVIKLNESTFLNAANATVTLKYADGTAVEGTGEYVAATADRGAYYKFITTKTKAYDIVDKAIEITVTIPEADGIAAVNLNGTYSVGAYINATDNDLVKAMYEFGAAAKDYRDVIEAN